MDHHVEGALPGVHPLPVHGVKIAATASVVGTIIGEDPAGTAEGLGRAITNFNQQYISGPEKLWATILIAAGVGIVSYVLVRLLEVIVVGRQGRAAA